MLYRVACDY